MLRHWQIGLSVALLAAASLQAPFSHLHPGDPEHHHATGFVHAHLELAQLPDSSDAALDHDDDHETTINLDWAPTAAQRIDVTYTGSIVATLVQPNYISIGIAPEFVARSNSPPRLLLLPARAPPV